MTGLIDKLHLSEVQIDSIIGLALDEDISHGDITSEALIPHHLNGKAIIMIKEEGILAGMLVVSRIFSRIDPSLKVKVLVQDGTRVKPGDVIATISGNIISILKGERTALNFLQRMCGIASLTARYVAETHGFKADIYDTRKTTPGLRALEKYSVRMGGGKNYRLNLGDGILIKDNHLASLRNLRMSLNDIIDSAKQNTPKGVTVEIEVTTTEEALEALEAGADIIMLDNMSLDEMTRVAGLIAGRAKIEASGGITLDNVRQVAEAGVDIISIGALTHSYKALDISLEIEQASLKLP